MKKHDKFQTKYICGICDQSCGLAHTLKEHYWDIHDIEIETEYANSLSKLVECTTSEPTNHPKRIHDIFTCTCSRVIKSKFGFKRHVEKQHLSTDYDSYDKSKVDSADPLELGGSKDNRRREGTLKPVKRPKVKPTDHVISSILLSNMDLSILITFLLSF